MSDPLGAIHTELNARMSGGGVPRNYGDPAAEYEAARSSACIVDRTDRALLRMHGRDPLKMIQGLVTNDVAGALPDRAVYAALLTPKGRMVADLRVIRRGAELLLETARDALPGLTETLKKFVPPLFARVEDVTSDWKVIGVYGPRAAEVLEAAFRAGALPAETTEDALCESEGRIVIRTRYAGDGGFDVLVPADEAEDAWRRIAEAGARPAGHATLDVRRIEEGRPRWGAELTNETIPLEANLLERAISTGKGCYTGQEVIIRILHRGHVNWHLRGILLGDVPAPAAGTQLLHPDTGKVVGRITSACASPLHHQTIALGYARRELQPPVDVRLGATDGSPVTVIELPFPISDLGGGGDPGLTG
jgi:tRNA-modifying protein YgfZ